MACAKACAEEFSTIRPSSGERTMSSMAQVDRPAIKKVPAVSASIITAG